MLTKLIAIFNQKILSSLNHDQHSHLSKKVLFYENFTTQFLKRKYSFSPQIKTILIVRQCHLKVTERSILEHLTVIP